MFKFLKKQDEKSCCSSNTEGVSAATAEPNRGIIVLGSGCAKCTALEEAAREAVAALGLDIPVEHVTDYARIASYGVMRTPALVLNGKVVASGEVLSAEAIKKILTDNR